METLNRLKLNSGHDIPVIGLGTYKIKDSAVILQAIKNGYRHIDTAEHYLNEEFVGEAISQALQ
jgi:2,5-diketo-D-gluconate reductase A